MDFYRPLVYGAEHKPPNAWVLVTPIVTNSAIGVNRNDALFELQRIDDDVYAIYADACQICRQLNQSPSAKLVPHSLRIRVVDITQSLPRPITAGRSRDQWLNTLRATRASPSSSGGEYELCADFLDSSGYLSLKGHAAGADDVCGILQLCILAAGAVTQLGLSRNCLEAVGTQAVNSSGFGKSIHCTPCLPKRPALIKQTGTHFTFRSYKEFQLLCIHISQ